MGLQGFDVLPSNLIPQLSNLIIDSVHVFLAVIADGLHALRFQHAQLQDVAPSFLRLALCRSQLLARFFLARANTLFFFLDPLTKGLEQRTRPGVEISENTGNVGLQLALPRLVQLTGFSHALVAHTLLIGNLLGHEAFDASLTSGDLVRDTTPCPQFGEPVLQLSATGLFPSCYLIDQRVEDASYWASARSSGGSTWCRTGGSLLCGSRGGCFSCKRVTLVRNKVKTPRTLRSGLRSTRHKRRRHSGSSAAT